MGDVLLVQEALREHQVSAELEVINDGETAYRHWNRYSESAEVQCPDLVLLDLNLPRRSGLEILERIRQTPACAALKVIIVSSSMHPPDVQRAHQLGIQEYFRKPTHLEGFMQLGAVVNRVLHDGVGAYA
jgi:CheY-like chemotaxis protein